MAESTLIRNSYSTGYKKGYSAGDSAGYTRGYNTGYNAGTNISSITLSKSGKASKTEDDKGSWTQSWTLAAGNYIACYSAALNRDGDCLCTMSITGGASSVTKLADLTQNSYGAWRTAGQIVYKFKVSSSSTVSFACYNEDSTDAANILTVIKVD